MATKATSKKKPAAGKNGKKEIYVFPPDSIEAKLIALGESVPESEWKKVPHDLFANIDHYLYGAPKRWRPKKK
jgi:hypothetical protein